MSACGLCAFKNYLLATERKRSIDMSQESVSDELRAAVERGDVQAMEKALESGVSPNSEIAMWNEWKGNKSLLYLAAEVRELELEQKFSCTTVF